MAHCDRRCLMAVTLGLVLLAGSVRVAEARSIGCGPAVIQLSFYPNDTAIIKLSYVGGSADPDILGYYVELYDIPEGMFVSLEEDTEVRYIEVPDPSCPRDSSKRWPFPVYVGRVGPGVEFGSPQGLTFGGLWPPGLPIVVIALNRVEMSYKTPEIPRGSWTFTNTSPHDIVDGVVYVPGLGTHSESMRYIPGLVIPAGGSLTVQGQMDSGTKWAFGGILDSPEPQPVFAFDAGGVSPEGMGFSEVFTADTDYSTTGLDAALRVHGAIQHMGPQSGYVGHQLRMSNRPGNNPRAGHAWNARPGRFGGGEAPAASGGAGFWMRTRFKESDDGQAASDDSGE